MNTIINSSSINTSIERWQSGKGASFSLSKIVCITVFLLLMVGTQKSLAQGVGISETTITADASAILELKSNQRGLLIPRMTTLQRLAIASPAAGLMVYDTDTKSFWYYEGGWKGMPSSAFGTGNQILGINAGGTANEYKTLNGTANQITVTHAPGSITLSTPQDIHKGATPEFAGLTLTSPLGIKSGGTNSATALTGQSIMISNGNSIIQGDAGTTTTVLHGNASGAPTYGQILTVDIADANVNTAKLADNAVTTGKIANGAIIDANVNASAAIAGTKISPDFGSQNVITTGTLTAGNTSITGNITVTGTVDGRHVGTDGTNQDALQNLSGITAGTSNLGTFTGSTIADNTTVKNALQQLETATETGLSTLDLTKAYGNGNNLVTSAGKNVIVSGTEAFEITATKGLIANTADINGGTIDGTTIGATSAAAATVTNLSATGTVTATGLITGNAGTSVSGGAINLNAGSNNATNINTGSSTGAVTIGGSANTVTLPALATAGVVHNSNTGVLSTGTIVNADVDASAAIAGTKISPDFGSQNVITTGTLTAENTSITGNITVTGTVDGRHVGTDGTNQDALQDLSGITAGTSNLGTFTGSTIADNTTVKNALQQLETATETGLSTLDLTKAYGNGNNLVTSAGKNVIVSGTEAFEITATKGLIANTADINGGTIDGTTIGATSAAAATVTNLSATGTVTATGLITGNAGTSVSGGAINLNAGSNNATNINTGSSTGAVTIGGSANTVTLPALATAGVVHNSNTGVLSTGTIVNADVDAAAAIAGTKISPDFGSQNVITTGTLTAGNTTVGTLSAGNTSISGTISVTGTVDGRHVGTDGTNQDALQDLSGITAGTSNLGTFTGSTIADNTTVKNALQQLETATETGLSTLDLTKAYGNGNNLVTSAGKNVIVSGTEAFEITATKGLIANTADINGGTIDGTTIGATSAAAATVTNLSATGTVTATGLITGNAGTSVSGGTINLNAGSNNATNINTGSSTGAVTIGGSANTVTLPALNSAGVVHNSNTGVLSTGTIVNADVDASAAIADTKLATISTAGKVSNSATTATSAKTVNAIVARDVNGDFSANKITADLVGNVTGNVTGNTSGTAANVTGIVVGANGGTGVDNTGKTITLGGNLTTTGAYSTELIAGANTSVTLPATGTLATLAGTETFSNKTLTSPNITTPTGIVKGDVGLGNVNNTSDANKPISTATQSALNLKAPLASPSFTGTPIAPTASAGTSTTQVATTEFVTSAITTATPDATTAIKGKVKLAGDLSGSADLPSVSTVGTSTATNIHSAEVLANAATNANTASTIVKRDASGNFSAGMITANVTGNVTGNASTVTTNANLTGDVTSVGNATTLATVNTSTPGTYGSTTSVPIITVNGKGLVTASSAAAIAFPVTLNGTETLTNKTINGLTPTSQTTGFTISGGSTSKTLTVSGDATISGSTTGTNTGDITIAGQNYLSLTGQTLTAKAVDLSGTNVTGILPGTKGGTGVDNGAKTITLGGNLTTSGANDLTLTTTGTTNITLPTTGTLYGTAANSVTSAQLATTLTDETGSGAAVFATSPSFTTPNIGAASGTSLNLSVLTASRPLKTDGSKNLVSGTIDLSSSSDVTGILPVANGGTGISTALTPGSVIFAGTSGELSQDNTNLFWDNSNKRLGINTTSPGYPLDVNGKLHSNSYIMGTDLSLLPVANGQSALTSWWGLQLIGNREFTVDYSPTNYGNRNDFSVIIPNQQPDKVGLIVQGTTSQTGDLQEWRNSTNTVLASVNSNGNLTVPSLSGNSGTPTGVMGPGANNGGTPAIQTIIGTNLAGKITITTSGTNPATSAIVTTITFANSLSFPNGCFVQLTPGNETAAELAGSAKPYISSTTQTGFTISATSTKLNNSTTYVWYYQVTGY